MLIPRARRLVTITLLAAAATGMSGCCGSDGATAAWALLVFGGDCQDAHVVTVEIVRPDRPVVAGEPVRLMLRVRSDSTFEHTYYWDLDGDRRTDVRKERDENGFSPNPWVDHTFPRAGRVRVGVELFIDRAPDSGRDSASLEIDVQPPRSQDPPPRRGGDQLPIAEFVVPERVAVGERFALDARASRDPDGKIVEYRWDLEGAPEAEIVASRPVEEHMYDKPGERTITLTVRDNRGGSAQAQRTILVTGQDRAAAAAAAAKGRRFSARLTGLFPARTPRPTARGLTLSGLRGSGRLRATLDSPMRPLGRLAKARWRGRVHFDFNARTGIARLRGRLIARGRGRRPPRVCLRLAMTAPPFGRPAAGKLTVLGGTRAAAFLRGSARFKVSRVSGSAVDLNGRLKVRKRARPRGMAACLR